MNPMGLSLNLNFGEPGRSYARAYTPGDDFYEELIALHQNLSDEQSAQVNARLILLLANHIGDLAILREAMTIARQDP
jgi:hypothetical protein|nr:DUF2783 domain-containing protein [uncultured Castellaniella sp.]